MKSYFHTVIFALLFLFSLLTLNPLLAQGKDKIPVTERDYQNSSVEMADNFRADGKIYVVVAVLVTIFAGITVYLVMTDRRVSKLEKEVGLK